MSGLFLSELIFFLVAELIGFVLGWRLFAWAAEQGRAEAEHDIETLRTALSEAQVRRARAT